MDKAEVQARVKAHITRGDFTFPEDLARAVADALDVDVAGTYLGQVPAAESPTRGDVPPFSGTPATEEHAAEGANEAVAAANENRREQFEAAQTGRPTFTRDSVGADPDLPTEIEEEGPIRPEGSTEFASAAEGDTAGTFGSGEADVTAETTEEGNEGTTENTENQNGPFVSPS